MDRVWQTHQVLQHVRHWHPDPSHCSGNCCATSPDHSASSGKNEEHSYNHNGADLSPEREVIYGRDSSSHDHSDSDAYRSTTRHFHANYFASQSTLSQGRTAGILRPN